MRVEVKLWWNNCGCFFNFLFRKKFFLCVMLLEVMTRFNYCIHYKVNLCSDCNIRECWMKKTIVRILQWHTRAYDGNRIHNPIHVSDHVPSHVLECPDLIQKLWRKFSKFFMLLRRLSHFLVSHVTRRHELILKKKLWWRNWKCFTFISHHVTY